jgi:hypothetical protein
MGKVLKPLAVIVGIGLQFIPGVGNFVGGLLIGAGSAAVGSALLGTVIVGAIGVGLSAYGSGAFDGRKRPGAASANLSPFDPRQINSDPAAPRKLVFGETPFPLDMRYVEPSGDNDRYIDYIFALAAHKSTSIDTIYIEDDLAWTLAGGAQGKYAGFLTIEIILEAGPSAFHTVNAGTTWGSNTKLSGCTTMKVRIDRLDVSETIRSPFGGGISGRWTVIGRGIPVYDPAQDSTVAGGSGLQRANNQATWAYTAGSTRGNNPALQLLTLLLGWRIGGRVSVGVGLPPDTINLASFAAAAAICDEPVTLAAGGTQRRYEAGRAFSDADDPLGIAQALLAAMNGELTDDGGTLSLRLAVDDLTPVLSLTDDDFISGYEWRPQPPIAGQFTVVRGRFSDSKIESKFGLIDYPEVEIDRISQAPRALVIELLCVQEQRRAERIATQVARRQKLLGEFVVTLGIRGWQLRRNMVVEVTSYARNWTGKLFRVRSMQFNVDGNVEVVMREEDARIYEWDADETPVVAATPFVPFDWTTQNASFQAGAVLQSDGSLLGTTTQLEVGQVVSASLFAQLRRLQPIVQIGINPLIELQVNPAQTVTVSAFVYADLTSGTGATTVDIEYRVGISGTWLAFATDTGSTETAPDPVTASATDNYTNATGVIQTVQFRAIVSLSGGAIGIVDAGQSVLESIAV